MKISSSQDSLQNSTRHKRFLCLFGNCLYKNKFHKSQINCSTNSLLGCPLYIWSIFGSFLVALISLLITLIVFNIQHDYPLNKSYFSECKSNVDCDTSIGLYCATQNGLCNCPAFNTKDRCDCKIGYFWNGEQCVLLMSINNTGCASDYQCDQSKQLYCSNSTCLCKQPMQWDSSQKRCDYKFLGCFRSGGGSGTTIFITANQRTKPVYFVETCINRCYNYSFTYANFYYSNSDEVSCYCNNAMSNTPDSCNVLCSGLTNRECGNDGNNNIRAVYLSK